MNGDRLQSQVDGETRLGAVVPNRRLDLPGGPGSTLTALNADAPWVPSGRDGRRARRRLGGNLFRPPQDRVAALNRHFGAPGKSLWWWWGLALLWIAAWPALIGARIGGLLPVSWWPIAGGAVLHLALLWMPLLLTVMAGGSSGLRQEFGRVHSLAQMMALEPDQFEQWTAMLFTLMGYEVTVVGVNGGDHGIDLRVSRTDELSGIVQCKRYRGSIGEPVVRDLYGVMMHENADYAWLVTTGAISRQARVWAEGKPIDLWDGPALLARARRLREESS